jgi:hypothetical protein
LTLRLGAAFLPKLRTLSYLRPQPLLEIDEAAGIVFTAFIRQHNAVAIVEMLGSSAVCSMGSLS